MQPQHRAILAMAQYPDVQPGRPDQPGVDRGHAGAQTCSTPGSTAKVITAAAALEHGGQTPMSPYTVPDQIVVDGFPFHDARVAPDRAATPSPASSPTPATSAWSRWSSTSARRCSTTTSGRSGSASPPACRCPATSAGLLPPVSKWCGDERYTLAVRPGRRGHRGADGQRLRDDRQRRGPGAADASWPGTTEPSRAVRARAARRAASRVIQANDRARADQHPAAGALARRARRGEPWGEIPGLLGRGQDRHRPDRRPGKAAACASTGRATSASPRPGPAARGRGQRAEPAQGPTTSATTWPARSSTT